MMKARFLFFALLIIGIHANAQQGRVALLIGNEEYSGHFQTLHTPINDVTAMKNVLQKLGFDTVIVGKNLTQQSMSEYLSSFKKLANGAELALFYYSGHAGYKGKDEYYLVPSNKYYSQATLINGCYSFRSIDRELKNIGAPIKFIIIDACRNSLDDSKEKVKDFSFETIKHNLSNKEGMVYWFSTSVGKPSHTGEGNYSVFTASILNHIGSFDNLDVVWNRISEEVSRANYDQTPERHEPEKDKGLSKNFFLNPKKINIHPLIMEGKDYYSIITNPIDATIRVNGTNFISGERFILKYGEKYNVKISANGYKDYSMKITATPYLTQYKIQLDTLAKATVQIRSNVDGATVYFDGEKKGVTPVTVNTYAGSHSIRIECSGYYNYSSSPVLKAGSQTFFAQIQKDYPWFFDWNDGDSPKNHISYLFNPDYQIGLQYLRRFDDSRFLLGANVALSTGLFSGLGDLFLYGDTNIVRITTSNSLAGTTTTTQIVEEYSDIVDPDHEAKTYYSNFMFLLTGGYHPCNGVILETGIGVASHSKKHYLPYYYRETVTTNDDTGEIVFGPTYTREDGSHWYIDKIKWSAAMRLGMKFVIPIETDMFLTLGGGYTHLFTNTENNSWDFSVGFSWDI